MKLFVTQEADQDLDHIEEYIGNDNPAAAEKFIQRLTDRFEQLADHPRIGRERTEYGTGVRSVAEGE